MNILNISSNGTNLGIMLKITYNNFWSNLFKL